MSTLRPLRSEQSQPVTPAAASPPAKPSAKAAVGAKTLTTTDGTTLSRIQRSAEGLWHGATDLVPQVHTSRNRDQVNTDAVPSAGDFTKHAREAFDAVDANHDGTLSKAELTLAKTSRVFDPKASAAISAMAQTVTDIEDLSDDEHFMETKGLMRADLDAFDQLRPDAPLRQKAETAYADALPKPKPKPGTAVPAGVSSVVTPNVLGPKSATGAPVSAPAAALTPVKKAPPVPKAETPSVPWSTRITVARTKVTSTIKTVWTTSSDKLPWVHEDRNRAQLDPTAKPSQSAFTKDARAVFDRVDANHDGTMSHKELNTAMSSPLYHKGEAAAVGALQHYMTDIEDLSKDERFLENDGITKKDLDQFDRLKSKSDLGGSARGQYWSGMLKISTSEHQLYTHGATSVTGAAIEQGSLGDCYFLASVAGVASVDPKSIQKMITANKDGTFTVDFPGRGKVTVTAPTDAELGRYATSGKNGEWLPVLEKAYAKSRNDGRLIAKGDNYQAIVGGYGKQGIKALTGSKASTQHLVMMSPSQLVSTVKQGQNDHRVMTISTPHAMGRTRTKANDLPTGHEYTLLGYDDASGKFRIRNPWGDGGPKNDGIHELTAKEVKANFDRLSVQRR